MSHGQPVNLLTYQLSQALQGPSGRPFPQEAAPAHVSNWTFYPQVLISHQPLPLLFSDPLAAPIIGQIPGPHKGSWMCLA